MKVNLYAVFDSDSGVYDGPFPGQADGLMMRKFSDMVQNKDTDIGKHPECFTLFKVGTWNDGTGELVDMVPTKLTNGVEILGTEQYGEEIMPGGGKLDA